MNDQKDASGKVMKCVYLHSIEKKTVEDEEETKENEQRKKAASWC
jgi:hypothetical protein